MKPLAPLPPTTVGMSPSSSSTTTTSTTGRPPRSVRNKIDREATAICTDREVPDSELADQLTPLIVASGVTDVLTDRWLYAHPWTSAEREDFTSAMFLKLAVHLRRRIDRQRIAGGASFCGWMYKFGVSISTDVDREVTSTLSRSAVPVRNLVSLDALTDQVGDIGSIERVRRLRLQPSNTDPDLADPKAVRASLARRRGARRKEALSRVMRDALGNVPLLRPEDPVESQLVRRLVAQCPRLARLSLDTFCARVDDGEPSDYRLAPEAMVAMWDATTIVDRQRLSAMPDRLLALLVEDVVRLAPRPRPRIRKAVREALDTTARQAPDWLLDDLVQAFWDEAVEPVSSHQTNITAAERQRLRHQAALNARRLPGLVAKLLQVPEQHAGRDLAEVRTFLCQTWAMAEAASTTTSTKP